ncbi:putative eps aminotransferase protein [Stappia aggregata IAM 12614]|nr:putative eps aminotransferase protein [Stappia aggregata IAM 12614] [Roseibium aggregatum IAM 12614]
TGAAHAIGMANGSVTLDKALRVLDIQPGEEVIVTPRSFVASASCVLLAGGVPVFADIDPDSQNITPQTIAPLITPRTVGILPVHLAGWPCDMDGILDLAGANNLARWRSNSLVFIRMPTRKEPLLRYVRCAVIFPRAQLPTLVSKRNTGRKSLNSQR